MYSGLVDLNVIVRLKRREQWPIGSETSGLERTLLSTTIPDALKAYTSLVTYIRTRTPTPPRRATA
eukprot:6199406-Pleurochrysis_carterae.AAC.1